MLERTLELFGKLSFATLLPTLLFISTADLALFANIDTLGYSVVVVAARAVLWALATAALFWVIFGRRGGAFRLSAARAVLFAAVFLLLNNVIFSISSDPRTGEAQAMAMDGAAVLAAIAVATLIKLPSMVGAAGLASFLIFAAAVGQHGAAFLNLDNSQIRAFRSNPVSSRVSSASAAHTGTRVPATGNIYHIILDGFHGPSLPKLLEIGSFTTLRDFQHYARYFAGSSRTASSIPTIMRGRVIESNEEPREFLANAYSEGLWKDLHEHGFRTSVYAVIGSNYCTNVVNLCTTAADFMGTYLDRESVDLWFLRLLPASLWRHTTGRVLRATETFTYPFSVTSWVLGDGRRRWRFNQGEGARHEMSLIALDVLLTNEPHRADSGEYVYLHALPPHAPYVYDRHCKWVQARGQRSYQETALCTLWLVDRLVARLKELDRYDSATIIVQSDHGHAFSAWSFSNEYRVVVDGKFTSEMLGPLYVDYRPDHDLPRTTEEENKTNRTRYWNSVDISTRASALLMIKTPEGVANPMDPDSLTSALQIRSYVLDAAGIAPFPRASQARAERNSSGTPVYYMAVNNNGRLNDPSNVSLFRYDGSRWQFVHTLEQARRNGLPFAPAETEEVAGRKDQRALADSEPSVSHQQ